MSYGQPQLQTTTPLSTQKRVLIRDSSYGTSTTNLPSAVTHHHTRFANSLPPPSPSRRERVAYLTSQNELHKRGSHQKQPRC